ncbi:MAG: hypothetical protein HY593_01450 [Candidatus Omnitrophica bacterium]|nr:hypothetical protein [Candidatus Omnitrophota bacterium]
MPFLGRFFMLENHNLLKSRKRRHGFLRIVSFVLVCSLLAEHISFANPELKVESGRGKVEGKETTLPLGVRLPESIGIVEDNWKAGGLEGWKATVFLIQDPHTNFSGQLNLSKVLDILLQRNPAHYVFLEGGRGNESFSFLRKYAPIEIRQQIAKQFL